MAVATVDPQSGRAIVRDGEATFVFREDADGPVQWDNVNEGMFLQPADNQTYTVDAGKYPYVELEADLKRWRNQHATLWLLLASMDPSLPEDVRQESAASAEELLAEDVIEQYVRDIFMTAEMSNKLRVDLGPTSGRAGSILADAVKKWRGTGPMSVTVH